MTDIRLLYVTAPDLEQARSISRALIEQRLVACANIFPQMESIYRWKGEIQSETEVVLILKTESRLVAQVKEAINEMHPYETPCVLSLPVESGAEKYISWLKGEVI